MNELGWRVRQEMMERRQRKAEESDTIASFCAVFLMVTMALVALLKWWEVM